MPHHIIIRNLGICDYEKIWRKMQSFTANRTPITPDELWLLEHNPVFTQGISGTPEHILDIKNIPIIKIDRGGKITYHNPGQLICYFLFDLRRLKITPKNFINLIENSVIRLLAEYKIPSHRFKNAPGVYVKNKKICSIGLKFTKGYSYHGIALNVNNDLGPFTHIEPCGYPNLVMTKMDKFTSATLDKVKEKYWRIFTDKESGLFFGPNC